MRQNVERAGRIFILMIFLLSLPACGTGGGGTGGSPPPSTSFSPPTGNSSPTSFGKIAIDSQNNVWVTTNTGLMEIPAKATSCATASDCPILTLGFGPAGIVVDGSGNIWVTNTGNGTVMEINSSCFSSPSSCPTFSVSTYFSNPTGIAVDSNNNIWVTNTGNGTVTEITSGTTTCSSSKCPTFSGSTYFSNPTGIAVDSKNNVWVTNTGNGTVTEITSGITTCSSSTNCPTFLGFSDPGAVTTTGTTPWVANSGTGSSYSPGVVEINSPCQSGGCPEITHFTQPVGLAFDTSGNLWVIDAGNSTTVEITASAIASATCSSSTPCYQYSLPAAPAGVATDSLGNIWISLVNAQVIEYKP